MEIRFSKYHGTGNDFIIIDKTNQPEIELSEKEIRFLCDRRFGIGADGLMIYSLLEGFDFEMSYYNANGLESTMCGNGGRCMADFWRKKGNHGNSVRFKGIDGEHIAYFTSENTIQLGMKDINKVIFSESGYTMDTGSPHLVTFINDIENLNVHAEGKKLRYSKEFAPDGINVNFVELKENRIYIRTYERGVEDETLSCGTGSVAAAIATSMKTQSKSNSFDLVAPGGKLKVSFVKSDKNTFSEIFLEGSASFVFAGTIII
jgi:diaminopimelate epimerase